MDKKTILSIFGLVAIVVVLVFGSEYRKTHNQQTPISHEFHGTLVIANIQGDTLHLSGVFMAENGTTVLSDRPQDVIIKVEPNTKITKTALALPSLAELRKTKGMYHTDDLKKASSSADFQILKADVSELGVGIFVKGPLNQNINNASSFTATEINYFMGVPSK